MLIKYESEYLAERYKSDYCIPVDIVVNVTLIKDTKYDTPFGSYLTEFQKLENIESISSDQVQDLLALYRVDSNFKKEVNDQLARYSIEM